jgi:hypothetical protein
LKAGSPRIALVVGGFGLNTDAVKSSIANLPGAVTLWFAPTGAAVDEQAAQAREAGHETVLQARLDGFPDSSGDPGSHASTTPASDMESLDSLRWQMGRFTGYVAVVKDLGDKSLANPQPAYPILREIANRGLGYLDDRASPRDVTPASAASLAMPSTHADIVIDANATPEAVDAALKQLVELARQRGSSIGVASATPASISLLAQWANELERKGIALVPLSALMSGVAMPFARSNESLSP